MAKCRKPSSTDATISGRILELGSDKPIEAAKVILVEHVSSCLFCPQQQKEIASIITDATGKYSFAYQDTAGRNYLTVFSKNNTFYERRDIDIPRSTFGTALSPDTFNIRLTPPAWVKIHFINQTPVDDKDEIRLDSAFDNGFITLKGQRIDTTMIRRCRAIESNKIYQFVDKTGLSSQKIDSISIRTRDTLSYEVRY